LQVTDRHLTGHCGPRSSLSEVDQTRLRQRVWRLWNHCCGRRKSKLLTVTNSRKWQWNIWNTVFSAEGKGDKITLG